MLLLCHNELKAELGTTPNIKQIVVGRCYNYITLVNPSLRFDCEEIWREFEEVVVQRSACNVRVKDYHRLFHAMPQTWPCDRFLFWSKTRTLVHSYTAAVRHFWTLEDTLVGYIFNDLIWCDFDFSSCPEWSACVNHPVYSLWRQASQNFAETACGNITVLLNGSIDHAFNRKSMFGSVELDSLNPRMVNHLHHELMNTDADTNDVSLLIMNVLLYFVHRTLMILQCVQNPKQSSCQTCTNSLLHTKRLPLN
uniref:ADP-ribosyl cyclase/cyclic ADP-ribose hydrolase n=1 Tax=Myripristis murdjan TaxID=586833 RepID=A0A667YUX0_9TELE